MKYPRNLCGMRFGNWLVLNKKIKHKTRSGYSWLCECQCEYKIKKYIHRQELVSGDAIGCEKCRIKRLKTQNKKYNTYDLSGEYGIGYTRKGEEFYFDLEDYDKIKDYCWYMDKNKYVLSRDNSTNKHVSMHSIIMNCPKGKVVDHINHKPNDNRKHNLRIANKQQNGQNRKNAKGYRYRKDINKYVAKIKVNGKYIHLGYFNTKEEAYEAYQSARIKYFGEFAPQKEVV